MELALRVTQPGMCSEHELVAAVRRGGDWAFEELFARYRSRIGSYVLGMVGDHGRAEDIVQEVFISALRRLRRTERPVAFKPWIYEIAKNACIDEFRRSRLTREVPLAQDDEVAGGERGLLSRYPATLYRYPTPDAAVESKQRLDDLRGAFGGLSESHHRILVLRELEGLSYNEIGQQMGMSQPVVESTLFRARRRLSEEYEELVSGRRCEHVRAAIDARDGRSLRSLGTRERRQLARHLAHCQPCRRQARMAGLEEVLFRAPRLAGKVAALLPIPWLRWRRASPDDEAFTGSGSHSLGLAQSLHTVLPFADPLGPSVGFGRATAAAAAIAIAGTGGGLVTGLAPHQSPAAPTVGTIVAPSGSSSGSAPSAGLQSSVNGPVGPTVATIQGTLTGGATSLRFAPIVGVLSTLRLVAQATDPLAPAVTLGSQTVTGGSRVGPGSAATPPSAPPTSPLTALSSPAPASSTPTPSSTTATATSSVVADGSLTPSTGDPAPSATPPQEPTTPLPAAPATPSASQPASTSPTPTASDASAAPASTPASSTGGATDTASTPASTPAGTGSQTSATSTPPSATSTTSTPSTSSLAPAATKTVTTAEADQTPAQSGAQPTTPPATAF